MIDAYRWTHTKQEDDCLMVTDGGMVRELLADEPGRWVLAVDFDRYREGAEEKLRNCETEMEALGNDLAEWKTRARAAEQELEDVRAEHRDDLVELRTELEARDE